MGRVIVVLGHALSSLAAAVLYFLFVLPRWWELTGSVGHTLGTALRIVTGVLIAVAAVPVLVNLLRSRRPEYGTPQLALSLRVWSIVGHVLAGVLIVGAAISEIWLSLDDAGQWLFAVYGAAAAIGLLGVSAFYLAFLAELPPPPPKPLKAKKPKKSRQRGRKGTEAEAETEAADEAEATDEAAEADTETEVKDGETAEAEATETEDDATAEAKDTETAAKADAAVTEESEADEADEADEPDEPEADEDAAADTEEASSGGLQNQRPSGKANRRRRLRGGRAKD